jgi:hypothetical protein
MAKILSIFLFIYEKNQHPLDQSVSFPFLSDPNFLRDSIPLVKKYCHVDNLESYGLWTLASSVKGRSWFLAIWLVEIDGL